MSFLSFNFILRCPTFWDRIFSSTVQVQIYFHPTHPVNQEYRRPTIDLTYFNPDSRIHAISICSLRQKPVTFKYLSPKLLGTHSTFLLYTLESSTPIRITTPGLDWRDEAEDKSRILYSSEIIPEFWENIAKSDGVFLSLFIMMFTNKKTDPTKYVLVQIFQTYSARLGRKNHDIPVIYRFAKTPVSQYVKDVFPVVKPPKPSVSIIFFYKILYILISYV